MLEQFLPTIKDPADYITALSLFRLGDPLTAEEAKKLLALYAKYQPEMDDPDYLKICLAVDLLPGRTKDDTTDFTSLELGEKTVVALFAAKDIIVGAQEITGESASEILEYVQDEVVPMAVRVLLARVTLDSLASSRNSADFREQIVELATFLTNCGPDTLDRYTTLVMGVRMKCLR